MQSTRLEAGNISALSDELAISRRYRLSSKGLPRQPHGFEGFGAVGEDMGAADLPVFEVVDAGDPRGGLDAVSASALEDEEGQNAPLYVSYLLDLESARLRVAPQLAKEVAYAFVPGDRPLK